MSQQRAIERNLLKCGQIEHQGDPACLSHRSSCPQSRNSAPSPQELPLSALKPSHKALARSLPQCVLWTKGHFSWGKIPDNRMWPHFQSGFSYFLWLFLLVFFPSGYFYRARHCLRKWLESMILLEAEKSPFLLHVSAVGRNSRPPSLHIGYSCM